MTPCRRPAAPVPGSWTRCTGPGSGRSGRSSRFLGIALGAKIVHRVHFERGDHIPASGPAIIVANHISETETLALARLVTGHHRFPHFLAKAELFEWPIVGRIMRAARQIPVVRGTARAGESLAAAARTLQRGHVVLPLPGGDPDPGAGSAARAGPRPARPGSPWATRTCRSIPVGMWGPRPGTKHLWHRHAVRMIVGEPLDLSPWAGRDQDPDAVRAATELIMARITELTETARGGPFDPVDPGLEPPSVGA